MTDSAVLDRPTSNSRRRLFAGLATAAVAGVAVQAVRATPAAAAEDQVLHLLRRTTYGPTPALVAEVRKVGAKAWLDAQLDPASIDDSAMDTLLQRWPRLNLMSWEWREQVNDTNRWELMYDVVESHLARAIWSKRQLFEVTVDFWANHLVIPTPSSEVYDSAHLFQRDVIRKHAFGKYADMLAASAKHPAMLAVLDNGASTKKAPNENYGRELLELHTVGAYSEADVKNAALALSGLTVDPEGGVYEYKPWRHRTGAVKVLDWSDSNASPEGQDVAMSLISYLAHHPKTATRIARKLCVRFVSDTPPDSLVDALAKVYLDNDTAIVPVLKALFASDEFAAAVGQKIKTPYEDSVATLRILGVQPQPTGTNELRNLIWTLRAMGNAPLAWPAPNGYPDVATAWTAPGATLGRFNHHARVAGGWTLTTMPRPSLNDLVPNPLPTTYAALLDALADRLVLDPLTAAQRTAICTFAGKKPTDTLKSSDAILGWMLKYVIAILLDSYNFAKR